MSLVSFLIRGIKEVGSASILMYFDSDDIINLVRKRGVVAFGKGCLFDGSSNLVGLV